MNKSRPLVEHFFRHESARLIAVLTRAFGMRRAEMIEDMVQSAILEAMNSWKHRGPPDNPSGWIHRVARNRILDALRREKTHQQALAHARLEYDPSAQLMDEWLDDDQLPDSLLRMMFVCCHPSLDRRSSIALTLKTLCGFSNGEIARGLLMPEETVRKRIQRSRKQLAQQNIAIELPSKDELIERLSVVHDVLYLIFNEGHSASTGSDPIRDDLCEEAARLCHLLCCDDQLSTPETKALLALMLFHAARLESRTDEDGNALLLEEQDRSKWDTGLIQQGYKWLNNSRGDAVTQYHLEAGIALEHCKAPTLNKTDWSMIIQLYDRLIAITNSPMYRLNRAIARGQNGDTDLGLHEIQAIVNEGSLPDYLYVKSAEARLYELNGNTPDAIDCLLEALSSASAEHERQFLKRKIQTLSESP